MKVAVVTNMAPFVWGGGEELCCHLVRNLRLHGAEAEAFRIPFAWDPPERLRDEMVIARSLRLLGVDRVIALKFPAYLVPADNKVMWLLHQFRQAYDLFDAGLSHLPASPEGDQLRAEIRAADHQAFSEATRVFTISSVSGERLKRYNGFNATVLPHPLNDPALFTGGRAEGYVLAAGRVNAAKRQALLVRALRHAPGVRLVVAGPPDSPSDVDDLRRLAEAEGVGDRLTLDLRLLPRLELAALVNAASAVGYIPLDEDSVGYVTMEAFHAGKPVISTTDSGGVLQLARDGETGWVTAPSPEALAGALRAAAADAGRAARFGAAGREALSGMGLSWPRVVEQLLS